MFESYLYLMPALVQTLSNVDAPVEITKSDWELIKKVLKVLKPFQDATKMLSEHDASVSMAIPIITTIMKALEVSDEDQGVKTMKRALMRNMSIRFATFE